MFLLWFLQTPNSYIDDSGGAHLSGLLSCLWHSHTGRHWARARSSSLTRPGKGRRETDREGEWRLRSQDPVVEVLRKGSKWDRGATDPDVDTQTGNW